MCLCSFLRGMADRLAWFFMVKCGKYNILGLVKQVVCSLYFSTIRMQSLKSFPAEESQPENPGSVCRREKLMIEGWGLDDEWPWLLQKRPFSGFRPVSGSPSPGPSLYPYSTGWQEVVCSEVSLSTSSSSPKSLGEVSVPRVSAVCKMFQLDWARQKCFIY